MRPAEQVADYIEREFLSGEKEARLPTVEEMAAHLQVSVSTVLRVVRRFAADGRLVALQGRGTFVKKAREGNGRPLFLATNHFRSDPAVGPGWTEWIYLGAVNMASRMQHKNISVMPVIAPDVETSLPQKNLNLLLCGKENYEGRQHQIEQGNKELLRRIDEIDMLLLFPFQGHEKVRQAYENAGKPVVAINPPEINATANFVSADFFKAAFRIGRAWHDCGRRNFIFIGPVHREVMVSTRLLLMGFSEGVHWERDKNVRFRVLPTDVWEPIESLERMIADLDELPDAIFCSGDVIGSRVLAILRKMGHAVPRAISVAAGTGYIFSYFSDIDLTRILQPMDQIGANAVRVLCHRLENQNSPVPGLYLSTPIHPGNTTRPEENSLFIDTPETDKL